MYQYLTEPFGLRSSVLSFRVEFERPLRTNGYLPYQPVPGIWLRENEWGLYDHIYIYNDGAIINELHKDENDSSLYWASPDQERDTISGV
jgi:hypothetical protein